MAELQHHSAGPSASHKWLNCPGSINAEKGYPNISSPAADEGSAAHVLAERTLNSKSQKSQDYLGEMIYKGDDGTEYFVDKEMVDHIQDYVDYVMALVVKHKGELFIETKINLDAIVPGGFGTADAIIVCKNKLFVIDLKYGKGIKVDAVKNSQGLCYAAGAFEEHNWLNDIEDVQIHIYQPRMDNISEYHIKGKALKKWIKAAHEAFLKTIPEDAPRLPGKKQCHWCLAKGECKAYLAMAFEDIISDYDEYEDTVDAVVHGTIPNPKVLTLTEMAAVFERTSEITQALKKIKEILTDKATKGYRIPGHKLVRGRGSRGYIDEERATKAFIRKLGTNIVAPRKLLTPPQLELITDKEGKKVKDSKLFNFHVEKKQGNPILVQVDDIRTEIIIDINADYEDL